MPDTENSPDQLPVPQDSPEPQGTVLWNLQTQAPEYVPLTSVKSALAAGTHRTYAGSEVDVQSGIGAPGALDPQVAQTTLATGGRVVSTSGANLAAGSVETQRRAYDNAGDKALALADGFVETLSGDLLGGLPTSGSPLGEHERTMRDKVNPGAKNLGSLAALAATMLAPESALKYTPLGGAGKLMEATGAGVRGVLGEGILVKGVSEAAGGAAASAALSTANAVQSSAQGKPVSGYAIIDDVGLGAAVGGVFGLAGGFLGRSAGKIGEAKKAIEAAGRFDESAAAIRGSITDVSTAWDSAHTGAKARLEKLNDLVDSGLLDGSMPGKEWLEGRTSLASEADRTQRLLHKIAGTEDPVAIAARIHDLAVSGKAKEAERLYKAFDEYGTAVSAFDDAMTPTMHDRAHIGDVLSDLDESMSAKDHPLQQLEEMINRGASAEEIDRFSQAYDRDYNARAQGHGEKPVDESPVSMDEARAARAEQKTGNLRARKAAPEVDVNKTKDIGLRRETPNIRAKEAPAEAPTLHDMPSVPEGDVAAGMRESVGQANEAGTRVGASEKAAFEAMGTLGQHAQYRAAVPLARPTDLGSKIQLAMDQFSAAAGGRLGSEAARAMAKELGMNMASLTGPVASRLGDLWALHRLSKALGELSPGGKPGFLGKALRNGAVSSAGLAGYNFAGPFGGGASRSMMSGMMTTAMAGAAGLTRIAGKMRQSAILGMNRVLSPFGRKALTLSAVSRKISATYSPDSPPTSDYQTKAAQLRRLAANPDAMEAKVRENLKPVGAVNPAAYEGAVDAAMTRLKNLAHALPNNMAMSYGSKTMGPTIGDIDGWHAYEAITANRELIFDYLKSGYVPERVREAMQEQHPDYLDELREYAMTHPDEIQAAGYNTKKALSQLLGMPLVPVADPNFVMQMQEPYQEAAKKAAQAQMTQQGAMAMKAGQNPLLQPTLAQILTVPRMN